MKQIPLKVVEIEPDYDDQWSEELKKQVDEAPREKLSYKTNILRVARLPLNPKEGMDIEEMISATSLIKKAKEVDSDGVLILEGSEYDLLVKKAKANRFNLVVDEMVEMYQTIFSAEDYELPKTTKADKAED